MTKDPRGRRTFNIPGHAHELTFGCSRRYPFLRSERTCSWLVESIAKARVELDLAIWAYVFMPDHVHLIVCPSRPRYAIAEILTAIKQPVARRAIAYLRREAPEWLDRVAQRRGRRVERHFWQPGGGCDRNVVEPRTLTAMMAYLHLNPVRRGLVERARDWRWSTAAWYECGGPCELIPDPIPPEWTDGTTPD